MKISNERVGRRIIALLFLFLFFVDVAMDGIQQLIQNKDYAALVKACERVELQVQWQPFSISNAWLMYKDGQMAASPSANWNIQEIYAVLLLAYALVDDL